MNYFFLLLRYLSTSGADLPHADIVVNQLLASLVGQLGLAG